MANEDVERRFAAVYWTFPVPWAGFTDLPKNADAAAARSRTVRYQRDLVRAHVLAERGTLLREFVFMETSPDRGTDAYREIMDPLVALCGSGRVAVCYVDFTSRMGWRKYGKLSGALDDAGFRTDPLAARPFDIDGEPFDPADHFEAWRGIDRAFRDGRALTARQSLAAVADETPPGRGRHSRIAERLNAMGVRTHSGLAWTPDNVRMALGKAGASAPGAPPEG